jgi:putative peptide zinc metalloprotease protein
MTATTDQSTARPGALPGRAEGIELLGELHGSGYRDGVALVRRADGQVVQLGPLMYALLEVADGRCDTSELASLLSERLGRIVDEEHVVRLAEKLAAQGLLAGTEHRAPPRRNPLLALRWKVLVTNPRVTRALTAPFTILFRPLLMWPIVACFVAVAWFVLLHKGVASATSQAFHRPTLLLLVFVLALLSAGFHELGHATACRYSGATPGGMGAGIYMVWPAFYTDVTDAYRLPRRDRLRVDLGGIYFNAVIAVVTTAVWLEWRVDALLLVVALQLLIMVKNLSPVIRSDGYHILADTTGIPDLYAHIGPTLRRLVPWRRRDPSALTGRARLLVTAWVLVVVPVLLSLMLGAIVLLPRLLTSAWDSGRGIVVGMPHESATSVLASILRLVALLLPVLGSALITQRIVRMGMHKGGAWSAGRPVRRTALVVCAAGAMCGSAWALWPAGQYQPVSANASGTLGSFVSLVASPQSAARPVAQPATVRLAPGTHLAVAMIPVGGATKRHPALFVIEGDHGHPAIAILSTSAPDPSRASGGSATPVTATTASTTTETTAAASTTTTSAAPSGSSGAPVQAVAFPFELPSAPGPGGTQAVAVGRKNGRVVYDVAYSLVTVSKGAPVTNTNAAYALASCKACTTVAVSFQVVLVVGRSAFIAPIDAAIALNSNCPACMTTAIADQIVVTLTSTPTKELAAKLESALQQLNALPSLGANGTPSAVAAQVAAVQQQIVSALNSSGQLANPIQTTTTATTTANSTTTPATTTTRTAPSTTTSQTSTASTTTSTTPPTTTEPTTTGTTATSTTTTTDTTSTTTGETTMTTG